MNELFSFSLFFQCLCECVCAGGNTALHTALHTAGRSAMRSQERDCPPIFLRASWKLLFVGCATSSALTELVSEYVGQDSP